MNTVKALAEQHNWDLAHGWYLGLPIVYKDVDLGDVMTYDVLRVLGWHYQQDEERKRIEALAAEQQAAAAAVQDPAQGAGHVETYPIA